MYSILSIRLFVCHASVVVYINGLSYYSSLFKVIIMMQNVKKHGLVTAVTVPAIVAAGSANAAIDVSSTVSTLVGDGTTAISAVGVGLITLAGVAIVFKWVKAAFFS